MQLELPFLRTITPPEPAVRFVRQPRAKKYILRVAPDGSLRVTIPRGGSRREADAFLEKHRQWAEQERMRVAGRHAPVQWQAGQQILLRGAPVTLRLDRQAGRTLLVIDAASVSLPDGETNLRRAAERVLRQIALRELVPRLHAFAAAHGLPVARTTVRDQRSRWGSCSRAGAIALNFRLIQMPPPVCDYVLLHELMHLREGNHSRRFWRLVADVCPDYREAERWLRVEGRSLF